MGGGVFEARALAARASATSRGSGDFRSPWLRSHAPRAFTACFSSLRQPGHTPRFDVSNSTTWPALALLSRVDDSPCIATAPAASPMRAESASADPSCNGETSGGGASRVRKPIDNRTHQTARSGRPEPGPTASQYLRLSERFLRGDRPGSVVVNDQRESLRALERGRCQGLSSVFGWAVIEALGRTHSIGGSPRASSGPGGRSAGGMAFPLSSSLDRSCWSASERSSRSCR